MRCPGRQIHNGSALFECELCGHRHCTLHKLPFHDGKTCEDYDAELSADHAASEEKSRNLIEGSTVKCPGTGCGFDIEKENNDGCDTMTCKHTSSMALPERLKH
jgi:hypothetical protein